MMSEILCCKYLDKALISFSPDKWTNSIPLGYLSSRDIKRDKAVKF